MKSYYWVVSEELVAKGALSSVCKEQCVCSGTKEVALRPCSPAKATAERMQHPVVPRGMCTTVMYMTHLRFKIIEATVLQYPSLLSPLPLGLSLVYWHIASYTIVTG